MIRNIKIGDELIHKFTNTKVKVIDIQEEPFSGKPLIVQIEYESHIKDTFNADFVTRNFLSLKDIRKQKLKILNYGNSY